jgi:hypothetical protein
LESIVSICPGEAALRKKAAIMVGTPAGPTASSIVSLKLERVCLGYKVFALQNKHAPAKGIFKCITQWSKCHLLTGLLICQIWNSHSQFDILQASHSLSCNIFGTSQPPVLKGKKIN